ncbi:alpha/beta hydrolase [Clostridium sp. SHJSY1]|uniref:alpha/beta fold hydrolase n=1 Tax=Clostridium sp. SHJSY1 TaxID=2942483 RepID=UPI0028750FDF|nr:alpha/beta fold hydrolase [Clostridium sp. SHJSY1]MDS0527730.1 alpha/beta hydrolase [Clostridium sp. SHJSY1]
MNIEKSIIYANDISIPCIVLTPANIIGNALVIHGYGGCKEEQLGLAFRVSELGLRTLVIDLRGHGENVSLLDDNILVDVESIVEYCHNFGQKVVAIGHSLGARLALSSSADYSIAISPALDKKFTDKTQKLLKDMRGYRVKESSKENLTAIIERLPELGKSNSENKMIIYGSRDIPEIITTCNELEKVNFLVKKIDNALHNDIFTLEKTFHYLTDQLRIWFVSKE